MTEYTGYITPESLKATLELTGTTHADGDLPRSIAAASGGIDELCGRTFRLPDDSNDEVRLYTPARYSGCVIDDCAGATEVSVSGAAWVEGTDWTPFPLNALAKDRPFTELLALEGRGFPAGSPASVQVTGRFGWPVTPAQIEEATAILATKLLRRKREAPFGVVTIGLDAGAIARIARNDPDVMFLVGPFMKTTLLA